MGSIKHSHPLIIIVALLLAIAIPACAIEAGSIEADSLSEESIAVERVVPGILSEDGAGSFFCEFAKNGALVQNAYFVVLEKLPKTDAHASAYRQIYKQSAEWTERGARHTFDGEFLFLDGQIACPTEIADDSFVLSFLREKGEPIELSVPTHARSLDPAALPQGELLCATRLYSMKNADIPLWYDGAENRPLTIADDPLSLEYRLLTPLDALYPRTLCYSFVMEDQQGEIICPPRAFEYREIYLANAESIGGGVVDGILYADHVAPDMLTAEYWIRKIQAPDAVILSQEEIRRFNRTALTHMDSMHDLSAYPDAIDGVALKALIEEYTLPETTCYANDAPLSPGYWALQDAKRNIASIGEEQPIAYGLIVRRADGRSFPTSDFVTDTPGDRFFDTLQAAELMPGDCVLVLHESVDAQWLFVLNEAFGSWVPKEAVALCADRAQWNAARQVDDFLIVTADRFRLDVDPYDEALSGMELDMGVVLRMADPAEWPETISGRDAYGNYIVKLPRRENDGSLAWAYVPIPVSRDVSRGYLPFTSANVLKQAFKMLGSRYGWGGSLDANDCSGYVRQVYATFGFLLPRNSGQQSLVPARRSDLSALSVAEKAELLSTFHPGALLQFPGHIMFYLGEENGFYYVLSSAGSFVPLSSLDGRVSPASTVLVNDLTVTRKNGLSWFESLTTAISMEPER